MDPKNLRPHLFKHTEEYRIKQENLLPRNQQEYLVTHNNKNNFLQQHFKPILHFLKQQDYKLPHQ